MGHAERFEQHPVRTGLLWLAGLLVVGIVVMSALWGFGVVTAPWKGAGDAYQQKNSAQNWVAAQRQFNQDYQDVQAFQAKILTTKATLKAHVGQPQPADSLGAWQWQQADTAEQATLAGLQQQCANTVASYNTDARSYLSQQFRDADLPPQLDSSMCS